MGMVPPTEWLQDTLHRAYDDLKLGPVEVSVMRTDDAAVAQVRLLNVKNREGACAMSAFRFSAGRGDLKRNIQKEAFKAARTLEQAIWKEKNRRFDG